MGVTRRRFLQQGGMALAAWGVSDTTLWRLRDRYRQALAAPTTRKFALLIGINQYPLSLALEGCVTDVECQRELLIHRFGFPPAQVVTLTDAQATRSAVVDAVLEYLVPAVKAGDGVVIHFSGFGSTVAGASNRTLRPSLVLAEAAPTGDIPVVQDLLLETLGLLLRSLKTNRITTVLDTSYLYPGQPLQGNLRVRAYANPSSAQPSEAELALQETLLSQLKLPRDRLPDLNHLTSFPGVVLAASELAQVATEVRWNHFNAGLFTHTLTQALWQTTPSTTIITTMSQVAHQVTAIVQEQHPTVQGQLPLAKTQDSKLTPYFVPGGMTGAIGAIADLEETGNQATLWLGGLPAPLLEHYGVNALLTVIDPATQEPVTTLQMTAREGFTARAKVCCWGDSPPDLPMLQVGQWVQEAVRVLPRNIGLTVALDGSLERIERVDAISALTAVPRVSSAIAGEQPADLLFSKVQSQPTQLAALPSVPLSYLAATPTTLSYGLFSPGRNVILSTTGEGGEAVKVAVKRLVPKLQTLLATKLLNLTINEQTSHLPLIAHLEQVTPQTQGLTTQMTSVLKGSGTPKGLLKPAVSLVQIPLGSRIRFRLENKGTQPLYALAIALDTASNLQWLHAPTPDPDLGLPPDTSAVPTAMLPDTTITLPTAIAGSEWQVQGTAGFADTYLILSLAPFTQTLGLLASQQRNGTAAIAGTIITNPLDIVQAILQDLHLSSHSPAIVATPDTYTLDVSTWATLRFSYQVI